MIQWMLNNGSNEERRDLRKLAKLQLDMSLAAIGTTTMGMTNVLYDLVARPEYMESIREETTRALRAGGGQFEVGTAKHDQAG